MNPKKLCNCCNVFKKNYVIIVMNCVYGFECNETGQLYFGSTKDFKTRMKKHRNSFNDCMSKHIIQRGNYLQFVIRTFETIYQARQYEDFLIQSQPNCINKLRAYLSQEEQQEINKNNSKKYYQEHKEELNEYNKKYNKEHKEEISECRKKYYQEHKKELNEYKKKYYQEHREEKKEYDKNYQEEHKEELQEYNKKYYEKNKSHKKIWRDNNKDKIDANTKKHQEKLKTQFVECPNCKLNMKKSSFYNHKNKYCPHIKKK